jgi:hypothetical protein
MADQKDLETYNRLIKEGQYLSGEGMETTMHMPCYFCAEPDFIEWKIVSMEETAAEARSCKACGRSAKMIFDRNANGVSFEIVQTGGPDPADYLPPMRRVS